MSGELVEFIRIVRLAKLIHAFEHLSTRPEAKSVNVGFLISSSVGRVISSANMVARGVGARSQRLRCGNQCVGSRKNGGLPTAQNIEGSGT